MVQLVRQKYNDCGIIWKRCLGMGAFHASVCYTMISVLPDLYSFHTVICKRKGYRVVCGHNWHDHVGAAPV